MLIVSFAGKAVGHGSLSRWRALARWATTAALFLLTAIGALGQGFVSTKPMNTARHGHVAVRLTDGRVLVASGAALNPVTTTEIYDPSSGQWSTTGSTGVPRVYGKAVRLGDGKVLLAGGTVGPATTAPQTAAEIYDPATGSWTATGSSTSGGSGQTLTLLPDGKALLLGGATVGEIYDPVTGAWTPTQPVVVTRRVSHTATLLPSGKVLIAGGHYNFSAITTCELYDPATGAFTATGSLSADPSSAPAALLPSGEVLRAGGFVTIDYKSNSLATAEIYDPATGSWRLTASLGTARSSSSLTLLGDGRVLASGGIRWTQSSGVYVPGSEVYDPATGTWRSVGDLAAPRDGHTATPLANGEVLIAGGVGESGVRLATAELYDATAPTLSGVTLTSSRAGSPAVATPGDVVTLSFIASQTISPPKVTLLGQEITATAGPGNFWSATATVASTSPHGPAKFIIAFQNSAGLEVTPVKATTDGSTVVIDTVTEKPTTSTPSYRIFSTSLALNFDLPEQPLAGSVKLIFRKYSSGELASTLVLGTSQEVAGNRTLTFNPLDPTANSAILSGSPLTEGDYSLMISYQDAAGNPPGFVSILQLRIDTTAPVITSATMTPAFARPGSTVTVRLGVVEQNSSSVSGTIGGLPVTSSLYPATATVVLPPNLPEGPLSFSLNVIDQAGNVSLPVTVAQDGVYTIVDSTAPVLTAPEFIIAEADSPAGALNVSDSAIIATDNLDPSPVIYYHRSHGNQPYFPLGSSWVDVIVYDAAGNTTNGRVIVKVVDTTKPAASVPATLTIPANASRKAPLGDLRGHVTSSDAVGVVSVVQTPDATTVYPVGSYSVSFMVSDAAGNSTTVQTTVTIAYAHPTELGVTEGAYTGQDAPDGPPAGTKLSTFGVPAISDLSDRATKVSMVKGRVKTTGILFEDHSGSQRLPAFQGGIVPGIPTGGVTFKNFLDPVLSPSGALAFVATVQRNGRAIAGDQGVWTDAFSSTLELVLREGSEVPGLEGAKLKSVTSLSLRDDGLLATVTLLPTRNLVSAANDAALVLLTGPTTGRMLLREGKQLGGEAGTLVARFSVLQPAPGSAGHGRWHGENAVVAKVTLRSGEVRIVKITPDGTVENLLSTSAAAGVIDASTRWKSFGLPAMDPLGDTFVLAATLRPLPGVVTGQNDVVLLAKTGSNAFGPFAREGVAISTAPGAPSYATFYDPVVNDQGAVAFLATLRGNGVTVSNKAGLFAGQPGSVGLVARLGQKVPDETGTLTTAFWSKFLTYALPSGDRPGLLFLAETSGGDTTARNQQAIWGVDSQNKLRRLLRTGAPLVNGGPVLRSLALLTSSPGSFGSTRSYNSTGSITVRATFADGSQSLLRIDVP